MPVDIWGYTTILLCTIPKLIDVGSVWDVLPAGIHEATMEEIKERFATNDKRKALFEGFARGAELLREAGCSAVFLDGGFVSAKPNPGDYDVCWDPVGVNVRKLDPVFLDFSNLRKKQKDRFGGEFFPASAKADGTRTFLEFFQVDKYTGAPKGIIQVQFQKQNIAEL